MAAIFDYTFHQKTRIGDDSCDLSQQNVQNSHAATYMLDNFRPACPMTNAITFATSQPAINFTGSHQVGINGCNIDNNSKLGITPITKPKCRISLQERPFATVPFLGRGRSNVLLEAQLQQGDYNINRKSVTPDSEICYGKLSLTPMIPTLKETVTNPANLIESSAAEGWIRGGLPARELTRDQDYVNQHTKTQYI
jgi:hypothetical protein